MSESNAAKTSDPGVCLSNDPKLFDTNRNLDNVLSEARKREAMRILANYQSEYEIQDSMKEVLEPL